MRSSTAATVALGALALATMGLVRLRGRFDLDGKVALVTGGSRGLGLAIATLLAKQGACVAIVARDRQELDLAAAELSAAGAPQVLPVVCDVGSAAQVHEAVEQVIRVLGPVDVLVNDAGTIEVGPFESMDLSDFEKAMATNFWGTLHFIRAVLPSMRANGGGRILDVSSIGGVVGVPHLLPYVASKFACTGLSLGLRAELAKDGILVTTACPGLMRTGSPPFAYFKGDRSAEYAWFSTSAKLPLVSASVRRAARLMVRAMVRGRAFVTVTPPARAAIVAQALAPGLVSAVMSAANRWLPRNTDARPATIGFDARA